MLLAIRRVVYKHTQKSFDKFAANCGSKTKVLHKRAETTNNIVQKTFESRESTHMEGSELDSPSISMCPESKIGGASSSRSSSRIKLRVRSTSQIKSIANDEQENDHSAPIDSEELSIE